MRTIEDMVQQEVMCCMSSLVSTLANGSGCVDAHSRNAPHDDAAKALADLAEQALELAMPVPDYEEAALQAGFNIATIGAGDWQYSNAEDGVPHGGFDSAALAAEAACNDAGIEPYDWEVYEHWAVSTWLAEKLIEQGEKVDTDFGSLNVWARTTTGQAISMDGCIKRIYDAMMTPVEA